MSLSLKSNDGNASPKHRANGRNFILTRSGAFEDCRRTSQGKSGPGAPSYSSSLSDDGFRPTDRIQRFVNVTVQRLKEGVPSLLLQSLPSSNNRY